MFLAAEDVAFVVVGGVGLRLRGIDHVPKDLDIVPETSPANLGRLTDAVLALGLVQPDRVPDLATAPDVVTITTSLTRVDVMVRRGDMEYEALTESGDDVILSGTSVRVASLADLHRLRAHHCSA